jgi:uncharacterized protein
MATSYKTPGVYVEEIPKLPPSVAQVETAIPAFIGYTQIATNLATGDLNNLPKRIGSLVEYELYYGYGPSPNVTEVNINDANNFVSASLSSKFYLYDSLRMFYANGGGDCFIVSIGDYSATIDDAAFATGFAAIAKESEPTILLFPDAVTLDDSKIANVQTAALTQCQDLQDRVTVMDVKENDTLGATFRNNVGINYLSYGAAYTPWLKVNLPKNVTYKDVSSVVKRSGVAITLDGLTSDTAIQTAITNLNKAFADVATVSAKTKLLSPPDGNLRVALNTLSASFKAINGNTNANLKALFGFLYTIAAQIDRFIKAADPDVLTLAALNADVIAAVTSNFNPSFSKVVGLETETAAKIATYTATNTATTFVEASWAGVIGTAATNLIPATATLDVDKRQFAFNNLLPLFEDINQSYLTLVIAAAAAYTQKLDESLALRFPVYKSILAGVGNSMTSMPPCGAVAGVYAATDRTRGVWKAPANISLTNVIAPSVIFTKTELENLNVDAVAGKSVNAIRSFFGKGTLVYGARTLAGNDNEWRYISVRRFFNMVEESTKNATEAFVFEPNDANTWVKVQGMIENFLTTLWRQGALQGVKPEHAFYVAVGLGRTMTALDILEGRMIVEIGMAVVRPAEFIILRFSHKMAES